MNACHPLILMKQMEYFRLYSSPVGNLILCATENELIGIDYAHKPPEALTSLPKDDHTVFYLCIKWLDSYFKGDHPSIDDVPFKAHGSSFQETVWRLLCEIPYGEMTTYGEIAKKVQALTGISRMSAQAIGGAVGRNPIFILIPCHRVIGASRNIVGYGGGLANKIYLLHHEGIRVEELYWPDRKKISIC